MNGLPGSVADNAAWAYVAGLTMGAANHMASILRRVQQGTTDGVVLAATEVEDIDDADDLGPEIRAALADLRVLQESIERWRATT